MDRKQVVVRFFILVCSVGAICLCSIRIYKYGLNKDSTLVDYMEFTKIKDYVFQVVSFCLCNMFLDDRLAFYGVNKSTYLEFLRGEAFENEMMTTNYQNVTSVYFLLHLRYFSF